MSEGYRVDPAEIRVEENPDTLGGKRFDLVIHTPDGGRVSKTITCGRRPPIEAFHEPLASWVEEQLNEGRFTLDTLPEHLVLPLMEEIAAR